MAKQDTESAKVTDIDSTTVSAAVLGNIFSVTDRRIRQMAAEGANTDDPDGEINIDEEKALHERIKRHISELKLQVMKGDLHKAEDVERVMMDMLAAFKTRLMNIPSKVAPALENRDAAYIKDRLTKEVLEVLNELKDYNPKDFYSDEYVEGEGDAD